MIWLLSKFFSMLLFLIGIGCFINGVARKDIGLLILGGLAWLLSAALWRVRRSVQTPTHIGQQQSIHQNFYITPGMGVTPEQVVQPQARQASPPPPPPIVEKLYHLVEDGKQVGPFAKAKIGERIRKRELGRDVLVWAEGMEYWMPLADVGDFNEFFRQLPPPPPTM